MKYLLYYLILINTVSFASMGIDKLKAAKGRWRISEKALFLLAALWVYQVSRTGSSPARIQMAVQVSFRAAMMAQAAVAASCGLIVLPLILLAGLVCSALSEKYSIS